MNTSIQKKYPDLDTETEYKDIGEEVISNVDYYEEDHIKIEDRERKTKVAILCETNSVYIHRYIRCIH